MITLARIEWMRSAVIDTEAQIRRLLSADAAIYRDIRLEALQRDPEAFSSTFAAEGARPLTWFEGRLERAAVFGAFAAGGLVGVAGFLVKEGCKQAHKGGLWGMYVRPQARRRGIGRRLVEAVIEHARGQVELIQLSVVSSNEPAQRLYVALGFVEYGFEKNALKHNGRYCDEVLMAKQLLPMEVSRS
jgi:ribosomal protein S18 acetylase RimI-like enzyme